MQSYTSHKLSLAPMMKYTDRHFRYLLRLMSPNIFLYTEMVTTGALIYGDKSKYLAFSEQEHPLALQVGGSDAKDMATVAKMAEDFGYDEININVGCPSDRVQSGLFGACLMAHPDKVADCVDKMADVVNIPITVKTRIGIDDQDDYEFLANLVAKISHAGCQTVLLHARKAWLSGLSPKENRDVPELNYPRVYQIKKDYADLNIVINGGIRNLAQINQHLCHVDGVMIGRQLIENPFDLLLWQNNLFTEKCHVDKIDILYMYLDYAEKQIQDNNVYAKHLVRHVIHVFKGDKGAKQWRKFLSTNMINPKLQDNIRWLRDYIQQYFYETV